MRVEIFDPLPEMQLEQRRKGKSLLNMIKGPTKVELINKIIEINPYWKSDSAYLWRCTLDELKIILQEEKERTK